MLRDGAGKEKEAPIEEVIQDKVVEEGEPLSSSQASTIDLEPDFLSPESGSSQTELDITDYDTTHEQLSLPGASNNTGGGQRGRDRHSGITGSATPNRSRRPHSAPCRVHTKGRPGKAGENRKPWRSASNGSPRGHKSCQ